VWVRSIGAALCASAAHLSLATAQDLVPEKSVSVRDRPRPEYEALGVRWGAFRLYPEITVGASYDDNIYATETNAIEDRISELAGNLSLRSQGDRLPISVYGSGASRSYSDNPIEDYVDWEGGGSIGSSLARRTAVSLSGDYTQNHESRGEPTFPSAAVERPRVETGSGAVEVTHAFASGRINVNVDRESADFEDAKLADGALFDQDFRDRDTRTLEVRGDIVVGQSTAVFVRAIHQERDYRLDSDIDGINRDATSDQLLGGVTLDISNLLRGEVGLGVLDLDNDDPSQSDSDSVAISSNVELYVTQLMTATIDVQRTSEAADIAGFASYVGTNVTLGLDYEIRRNLILSATFARTRREYEGVNEPDRSEVAGASAQWLVNRRVNVDFDYTLVESVWRAQAARSYTERIFAVAVSFAL
jgi:hypothetical protein